MGCPETSVTGAEKWPNWNHGQKASPYPTIILVYDDIKRTADLVPGTRTKKTEISWKEWERPNYIHREES